MHAFPPASAFSRALARDRLDAMECHDCGDHGPDHDEDHGHDHGHQIFLHGRCHPRAGADVCYANGTILVACNVCKKPIAAIAVAKDASDVSR